MTADKRFQRVSGKSGMPALKFRYIVARKQCALYAVIILSFTLTWASRVTSFLYPRRTGKRSSTPHNWSESAFTRGDFLHYSQQEKTATIRP